MGNKNDGGNSCIKHVIVKDGVHLKYEVGKERVKGKVPREMRM